MNKVLDFVKGLYMLGIGGPYYRHSSEPGVPWPHADHPLRNANETEIRKWVAAGAPEDEVREEVKRLSSISVASHELLPPLLSHHVYKPSKVTYTTQIGYYEQSNLQHLGHGKYRWTFTDPDFHHDEEAVLSPGHCVLHETRIMVDRAVAIQSVTFRVGNKTIQQFMDPETTINRLLQDYLGIPMQFYSRDKKYVSIPFFFTRDPTYGFPIFAYGTVELEIQLDADADVRLLVGLEALHSREEVRQVRELRVHRVEDFGNSTLRCPRWLFMNCFWKPVPSEYRTGNVARLLHDGSVDEEIRAVFWKCEEDAFVSLKYEHDQGVVSLVDHMPCTVLSDMELRTKFLPTMSGTFLTPVDQRRGYGGIALSRYMDSVDCEPGLSPRNGELVLELSHGQWCEVVLLTSRDAILV